MKSFKILTLVDITETNQYRRELGKELQKDQQQNFQMLIQTIGLRVNPIYTAGPTCEIVAINPKPHGLRTYTQLSTTNFGKKYTGNHKVWTFNFTIEYDGGLTDASSNDVGFLIQDLNLVPFIPQLTETVEFEIPVFDTKNFDYKNTLIYSINTE
jgi:hypothetical protein